MSLKRYQNELVILLAFLLMLVAFLYKNGQLSSQAEGTASSKHAVSEFKEIVALKKIWADKKEHGFTDKEGNDLKWEVEIIKPGLADAKNSTTS